jgi:hypothetical protein
MNNVKRVNGVSFLLGAITMLLILYGIDRCTGSEVGIEYAPVLKTDTVVFRDTVRLPVPEPVRKQTVKTDTVYLSDTVYIEIPIERIEYLTQDYRAVVEGYKPKLADIEVYAVTTEITKTRLKPARWAVTFGVGCGLSAQGKVSPFVGVSAGYVIWLK